MSDPTFDRLSRLFSAILMPLSLSCGGGNIDPEQFTDNLCDGKLQVLDQLSPSAAVDYIELRQWYEYGGEDEPPPFTLLDAHGQLCGGASDVGACEAAFAAIPRDAAFSYADFHGTIRKQLAYSQGDTVAAITDPAQLRSFLGTIDTMAEAVLMASMDGYSVVCDEDNEVGEHAEGYVVHEKRGSGCGEDDDILERVLLVKPDGTIEVLSSVVIEKGDPGCAIGRLPHGLCRVRRGRPAANPVGTFLAEVAHLEAAAVTAFAQLASELAVHRAPPALVRRAQSARRDEVRHARATAWLARRYGGQVLPAPRVAGRQPRSLSEVLDDNAVEGCVRETYGALVAHAQARQARDPHIRRILAKIARDETRHAALSWDLAHWAQGRMTSTSRRLAAQRQRTAFAAMEAELTAAHAPEVHAVTGLPTPDQARAMFHRLRGALT